MIGTEVIRKWLTAVIRKNSIPGSEVAGSGNYGMITGAERVIHCRSSGVGPDPLVRADPSAAQVVRSGDSVSSPAAGPVSGARCEAQAGRCGNTGDLGISFALVRLARCTGCRATRNTDSLAPSRFPTPVALEVAAWAPVWRVTYAFDPKREGILLAAGDKSGVGEKRFYKQLILKSDARYDDHLAELKKS